MSDSRVSVPDRPLPFVRAVRGSRAAGLALLVSIAPVLSSSGAAAVAPRIDACFAAGVLTCDSEVNGDTTTELDQFSEYSCGATDETGPESYFQIAATTNQVFRVSLQTGVADLDLFVVEGAEGVCDPQSCVAMSNTLESIEEVEFYALANQIHQVVVDGYDGEFGPFTLSVACLDIFADGFESGELAFWSTSVGAEP
jgi:hypothetical protein